MPTSSTGSCDIWRRRRDTGLLVHCRTEILAEASRYRIDRLDYDGSADRYSLKTVMGPDQFHGYFDMEEVPITVWDEAQPVSENA